MKCSYRILSAGFMMLRCWNKTRACCEAALKFKLAKVVCSCALLWPLLFKSPIFQNARPSPPKGGIANARPSYLYDKLGRAFSHTDSFYGSTRNDMIHNMNFKYNVITIKVCLRGSRKVLISQKLKRWSLQYLRALGAYLPAVLTPDKSSLRSPSTSNPFSICILVSPARGGYFALFLLELMSTNCANVESCAPASSLSCLPGQGDNTMESMSSHIEHLFPYSSQFTLLSLDGEHIGVWLHVQSQNIIFKWLQQLF